METIANLECFARSAEAGSFSAAARRMALTPAAVSRNVAVLEHNLGIRLFHRSTRKLTLTEAGKRFLASMKDSLEDLQAAIAGAAKSSGEPAGVLKISMGQTFGMDYILPLLPAFLERYPLITPDWHFDNRQVDLVSEGFDVAIAGGIELAAGMVSRAIAPLHIIAVASPAYMTGRKRPADPCALASFDGIVARSSQTGRVHDLVMRKAGGAEMVASLKPSIVLSDPEAICRTAVMGLGVALVAVPHALTHLENHRLVRLLPPWYVDLGPIFVYYASRRLLPAKTRAFIDFLVHAFRRQHLAERFAGTLG